MHTEDLGPAVHRWSVNANVSVEAAGSHKSLVQYIGSVGTCEDNNLFRGVEAIHLC
jgi:hypothetical protein